MIFTKILEVFWSWPTVLGVILLLYHKEIRQLIHRISETSKAKIGGLELEINPSNDPTQAKQLEKVVGKIFNKGVVELDGKHFTGCRFEQVVLRFRGTGPVGLQECHFSDTRWEMFDAAGLTMQFLSGLYNGADQGGRELVEATFESVRKGMFSKPPIT